MNEKLLLWRGSLLLYFHLYQMLYYIQWRRCRNKLMKVEENVRIWTWNWRKTSDFDVKKVRIPLKSSSSYDIWRFSSTSNQQNSLQSNFHCAQRKLSKGKTADFFQFQFFCSSKSVFHCLYSSLILFCVTISN